MATYRVGLCHYWLESRLSNYPSSTPIDPHVAMAYLGTFLVPISSQLALLRAQFSKPVFHSFRDFRTVKLTLWRVPPFWPKTRDWSREQVWNQLRARRQVWGLQLSIRVKPCKRKN